MDIAFNGNRKAMSIDIDDERNTDMGKKQFNT